jgi:glycolate oxidase iron-sulfur subunit
MSDMKELLRLLGELDDQLVTCMRCGMCQAVCPIYGQTGREADVARGKIALLEGLAHEMVKNPEGVQEKVNRCLLCGSCQANCPSGVKALDIFLKARTILTGYMGLPPVKKLIFRGMLTKPGLFNNLLSFASKFQGLFTSPVNDIVGSSCSKFLEPMLGERHLMLLAKTPLHKEVPSLDTKPGKSGLKVAFFPGCMADKIFPRIAHASLKVLKHHGVGVYMPEGQACCGIPALSSGDMQSYEKLVRLNLAAFAKGEFDYLVTPCATCTSTIKKIWPTMTKGFTEAEKKAVEALSAKVMDVNALWWTSWALPRRSRRGCPGSHRARPLPPEEVVGVSASPARCVHEPALQAQGNGRQRRLLRLRRQLHPDPRRHVGEDRPAEARQQSRTAARSWLPPAAPPA